MSKILLQLVASHRASVHTMQYYSKYDFLLKYIADILKVSFPSTSICILKEIEEIPDIVIDMQRRQCKSDLLLDWLLNITSSGNNNNEKLMVKNQEENNNNNSNAKLLALCNFDAYSNGLNFVFGQAHRNGKIAAVYLPRLHQEFYGLKENDQQLLVLQRVVKEAVHELGHAYGLGHCPIRQCVMHFSNSISDTDFKAKDFCQNCERKIFNSSRL